MRILFLGTDMFAVPTLEKLAKDGGHEIVAVVTRPDKPRGRGQVVCSTPVKETAEKLGIMVLEPKNLRSEKFRETLKSLDYEIVVLVAYGRVLPEEFLEKPPLGCICLHPSKLPEYRGCSPIECAILDGKEATALSVFYIEKDIDTGEIIIQKDVDIDPCDTGGTLRERLSVESPDVILEALKAIESGNVSPVVQDPEKAVYAPKICREDARIDWNEKARDIDNKIRAFNPKPGAFTTFRGKNIKILKALIQESGCNSESGMIIEIRKNQGPVVCCGELELLLLEVQPEGKTPINAWPFVLGYRPDIGEKFI